MPPSDERKAHMAKRDREKKKQAKREEKKARKAERAKLGLDGPEMVEPETIEPDEPAEGATEPAAAEGAPPAVKPETPP